jgi:2'-5' RNA ligase
MQTGLVLSLPVLAPALRSWRRRDPAARNGMPPHVTLLHPFMDSRAFDDDARARVAAALAGAAPIELTFDRVGRFPGGVWLEMAAPEPVKALIMALVGAFPDWPPFGGAFDELIPHLTVAQAPPGLCDRMEREVPRRLPLRARAEAVTLFARSEVGWIPFERFELG